MDTDVISNFHTAGELALMIAVSEEKLGVAHEVLEEIDDWAQCGAAARAVLDQAVNEGIMTEVRLERQELDQYAGLRRRLGAGEAASIAIAAKRGYAVGTDDRAARRICSRLRPSVRAISTEWILEDAVRRGALDKEAARGIWSRMAIGDPGRRLGLSDLVR